MGMGKDWVERGYEVPSRKCGGGDASARSNAQNIADVGGTRGS